MKDVYLLSGLGADYRLYSKLQLKEVNIHHVKWIKPGKDETIEQYATRLLEQIKTPNPILIGLSFGGMMAIEIARQIPTEKIILLSTVKRKEELPFYYRWAGTLRIHRLIPSALLKWGNPLSYWLFGAETKAEKDLLKVIFHDTDNDFLKWAIDKIVNWQNETVPANTKHIHGASDRVLPIRFIKADIVLKNAGHIAVLNRADKVSAIINEMIEM